MHARLFAPLLAGALVLAAAPARAQTVPPDAPLACESSTIELDRTLVRVCTYADGDQYIYLRDARVSGSPLLIISTGRGGRNLLLWTPTAERFLPQAWRTWPGDVLRTMRVATSLCSAVQVGPGTVYYYDFPDGATLYVNPTGGASCVR